MRITRFDLKAYGPFTETGLDLGQEGPGLHLIYGPNEAGKSSLLRALGDFLFGIPTSTKDGHLHPMNKLLLGAELSFQDGSQLHLSRRKGRKDTLLHVGGERAGESATDALRARLGPVDRAQFDGLFGLDHESLREGASALLANQGDVAQSMFDAGAGTKSAGGSIKSILDGLEEEAKELFAGSTSKRVINLALSGFEEARKSVNRQSLSSDAYQKKSKEVRDAEAERDRLRSETDALQARQRFLERHERVAPLLRTRAQGLSALEAMGELPNIAPEAAEERRSNLKTLEVQGQAIARLERKLGEKEAELQALSIPESLLALEDALAAELRDAAAGVRLASQGAPEQRQRLEQAQRELERERQALPAGARELSPPEPEQRERILDQTQRRSGLESDSNAAKQALETALQQAASNAARLAALPAPIPEAEAAALTTSLDAARRLTGSEEKLALQQRKLAEARADLESAITALALWDGTPEELLNLAVPSEATLQRAREQAEESARQRATHGEALESCAHELAQRGIELQAETGGEELPSEAKLNLGRQERDAHWSAIRKGAAPEGPAGDALEASTRAADLLADRLRHETARVNRVQRLRAEQAALAERQAKLEARSLVLAQEHEDQDKAWRAHWAALKIQPLAPGEMQTWRAQLAELQAQERARLELERQTQELQARCDLACAQLRQALHAVQANPLEDSSLEVLIELASQRIEADHKRKAQEFSYLEASQEAEAHADQTREREAQAAQALEQWKLEFKSSIQALGLKLPCSNEEVHARLEALQRVAKLQESIVELEHKLEQAAREDQDLSARLKPFEAGLAPPLSTEASHARADEILARRSQAQHDAQRRQTLKGELEAAQIELGEAKASLQLANQALELALQRAGAQELSELPAIEERVAAQRELQAELASGLVHLASAGDQLDLETLERELRELEDLDVPEELAQIQQAREALEHQRDAAIERASNAAGELERLQDNDAAELANTKEFHLERIRSAGRRFLQLRLAAFILRAEVESYRKANQGPLLARCASLFPHLTQGRYQDVRVQHEGSEAQLSCVTQAGDELGVEALSDGTRDQLYLALRIASIERHLEHGEPLPVVLDDILVHFDDERAKLALGVLGELAQKTQVLFFTHHTRIRELAREVLGKDLHEHELAVG